MHGRGTALHSRDDIVSAERPSHNSGVFAQSSAAPAPGRGWAAFALLVCGLAANGCHSTQQEDSSILASVVLRGNTPGQIARVTSDVFVAHEYKIAEAGSDKLIFEKVGSGMNHFAYGSWMKDDPIWVRVRVAIVPAGEQTFRLQCRAWLVRDKGGATEEEIKIRHIHHKPYDELLGEVASRLGTKPAAPS